MITEEPARAWCGRIRIGPGARSVDYKEENQSQ
jgi:hypothetical protein